jgi:predicted amidohydrolase
MEKHKVAVWQIHCGQESQPEKNLNKILDCLRQSDADGARLILFPELSLSG